MTMIRYLLLLLITLPVSQLQAQQEVPAEPSTSQVEPVSLQDSELSDDHSAQSLEALLRSVKSKEGSIASHQAQLKTNPDEVTREEILANIAKDKASLHQIESKFEEFAVSADISIFAEKPKESFDWQEKVGELLQPVFSEIENATKTSRQIGALRDDVKQFTERREVSSNAISNLKKILTESLSPALQTELEDLLAKWEQRYADANNQGVAADLQLQKLEAERKTFNPAESVQKFFRSRGLNLVLGLLAFCTVFFGIRILVVGAQKIRPSQEEKKFTNRLLSLLIHVFSIIGALAATLLVFNIMGDLFLQVIILIFLIGVAWASINTLPQHIETVKLLLNIGAVKEGQRVEMDGIPWCVDSLALAARLRNDKLSGGELVLPVRMLVGMHSREIGEREELFPCSINDWVELANGQIGKVQNQTPSLVELVDLGGSVIVYQTADFLAQSPKNLSSGYRLTSTFGVDYQHMAISTSEIPATFRKELQTRLPDIVNEQSIQSVDVEFMAAGTSSLDYQIKVLLKGDAAHQYEQIQFAVQKICVDACIENQWNIPFTQITLHQAE